MPVMPVSLVLLLCIMATGALAGDGLANIECYACTTKEAGDNCLSNDPEVLARYIKKCNTEGPKGVEKACALKSYGRGQLGIRQCISSTAPGGVLALKQAEQWTVERDDGGYYDVYRCVKPLCGKGVFIPKDLPEQVKRLEKEDLEKKKSPPSSLSGKNNGRHDANGTGGASSSLGTSRKTSLLFILTVALGFPAMASRTFE